MKKINKLILGSSAVVTMTSLSVISCDNTGVNYKWVTANEYGVPIPKAARDLHKFMKYTPNTEAIKSINANVAANVINGVDQPQRMQMLYSYLDWTNKIVPIGFQYDVIADSLSPQEKNDLTAQFKHDQPNSTLEELNKFLDEKRRYSTTLYATILVNDSKSGEQAKIDVVLEGFKPYVKLGLDQYAKIVDNVLISQGMPYLADSFDQKDLTAANIKDMDNAINWSGKMLRKYRLGVFPNNPLANFYYSSTFDNGIKINSKATVQEKALAYKVRENQAIKEANELIYRKEKQVVKDLEKNTIIDQGYSDAPYVRTTIQKLLFLAQSYLLEKTSTNRNNPLYHSADLKAAIIEIMNDLGKNYFYAGQQQFVNWWFYEIGIPRDLTKLMIVLFKILEEDLNSSDAAKVKATQEMVEGWTAGINYFLPNARYGGAAKTAILNYVPVTNKRLQTGANVIDNAKPILLANILMQDQDKINDAIEALYDNLFRNFVEHGDGFYYDGSFIQHDNLPYTGSYGEVLFTGIGDIFAYFAGTDLDISTDARFEKVYQFIELAVMPYMFQGSISDTLNGRSIVRSPYSDKQKGLNILGAFTFLVENAPSKYKARLHNFIIDQVSHFSKEQLSALGTKYKIKTTYINRLSEYISKEKMVEEARTNEDWKYYETSYFNKYNQPSAETELLKDQANVPVGVDLARLNNGLVFSKSQDRYVWKQDDFMFNLAFHGRKIGFTEATLGENLESYYYTDGAVLLHTSDNNEPYANDYYSIVPREKIAGVSAWRSSQFDAIDKYVLPEDLVKKFGPDPTKWKSEDAAEIKRIQDETLKYKAFQDSLRDKRKKIEDDLSLRVNHSYNNGIIIDQIGFVKARVQNWSNALATYKTYLMIDNQLIVVGNVDSNNTAANNNTQKDIYTTIENRAAIKNADPKAASKYSESGFSEESIKINNKGYQNFVYHDATTNETNAYVILKNTAHAKTEVNSKYAVIANDTRTLIKEKDKLENQFSWLYFDHDTQKDEYFAYSQIPNYNPQKQQEYLNVLQNIQILVNNRDYIVVKYTKDNQQYYFISSFVEEIESRKNFGVDKEYVQKVEKGVEIAGLGVMHFARPTTMVVRVNADQTWDIVHSTDYDDRNSEVIIDRSLKLIDTRQISNPRVVYTKIQNSKETAAFKKYDATGFTLYNSIAEENGEKHNVWFRVQEVENEKN
ncbi:hypothetical protein [Mycoplasmopsis pullorum]|uniref:Hyaluronate lyase n=1 Tax=Mycoplasmopsis pullorum TaxID=48003 RepID=A0A1L4FR88_9BACT|nr:hypothetical protein [Mycoplasmopsis pullorum]APJ38126.1 hypothetical protein BLA55_00250 [Mycoplasmopsis pullorum]